MKLNASQKLHLATSCRQKCLDTYYQRMRSAKLLENSSSDEWQEEAELFMWNILNKFDPSGIRLLSKEKSNKRITNQSLEFSFSSYFAGRVNFLVSEALRVKRLQPRG